MKLFDPHQPVKLDPFTQVWRFILENGADCEMHRSKPHLMS
jgi:hypothetical protein